MFANTIHFLRAQTSSRLCDKLKCVQFMILFIIQWKNRQILLFRQAHNAVLVNETAFVHVCFFLYFVNGFCSAIKILGMSNVFIHSMYNNNTLRCIAFHNLYAQRELLLPFLHVPRKAGSHRQSVAIHPHAPTISSMPASRKKRTGNTILSVFAYKVRDFLFRPHYMCMRICDLLWIWMKRMAEELIKKNGAFVFFLFF